MFPGLGWGINKIRFGFVGLFLRLTNNWKALEKITADAWMTQMGRRNVYEKMWKPLLIGKFGPYLSTGQYGLDVGAHQGPHHPAGHFRRRLPELRRYVRREASENGRRDPAETASGRSRIATRPGSRSASTDRSGKTEAFDKVLVTTSPALLAKLCPDLPKSYLKGLLELKSMGAVVMVLSLKHQLSEQGYYWFNLPKEAGYPFLALVEHTNFVGPSISAATTSSMPAIIWRRATNISR